MGFVDELLELAGQVGEIQCTMAGVEGLRFLIPSQPPPFEVELDTAKGKLRMMCARLGVLCHESGDPDVSLYGGEGIIKKEAPMRSPNNLAQSAGSNSPSSTGITLARPPILHEWRVRFKNTPDAQEFTIVAAAR